MKISFNIFKTFFFYSFFTVTVYANTTLPSNNSDTVKTHQSSTLKSSCITINAQRDLCGERARAWCKINPKASECRYFPDGKQYDPQDKANPLPPEQFE